MCQDHVSSGSTLLSQCPLMIVSRDTPLSDFHRCHPLCFPPELSPVFVVSVCHRWMRKGLEVLPKLKFYHWRLFHLAGIPLFPHDWCQLQDERETLVLRVTSLAGWEKCLRWGRIWRGSISLEGSRTANTKTFFHCVTHVQPLLAKCPHTQELCDKRIPAFSSPVCQTWLTTT